MEVGYRRACRLPRYRDTQQSQSHLSLALDTVFALQFHHVIQQCFEPTVHFNVYFLDRNYQLLGI